MIWCRNDRTEIPSPEIARYHPHLKPVANKIHPVEQDVPILLLLGRDILRVHKVREQINGPHDAPYAQRLDLGWVIVGEVCLGTVHRPPEVNMYKANILHNGRTSFLSQCTNNIHVREDYGGMSQHQGVTLPTWMENTDLTVSTDHLGCSLFERTQDDDKPALSMDDKAFLAIMDKEVYQTTETAGWHRCHSALPDDTFLATGGRP